MKIQHLGHSCLLVEAAGTRILVDPGGFSDAEAVRALRDLDAILLTHQHPDHADPDLLADVLAAFPDLPVHAEPETAAALREGDGFADAREAGGQVSALAPGSSATVGALEVRAVGGRHAVIHPDLPGIGNCGYVITADGEPRLAITGDSLEAVPEFEGIDALAFAVVAPWSKVSETVEFLRATAPKVALPVHDAVAAPEGREIFMKHAANLSPEATELRDWPEDRMVEIAL